MLNNHGIPPGTRPKCKPTWQSNLRVLSRIYNHIFDGTIILLPISALLKQQKVEKRNEKLLAFDNFTIVIKSLF
jgi:hypothetical protein